MLQTVPKNITIGTIDIVITDHMFPIITFLSLYRLSVHTAITIILSNNGMKIVITLMLDKCGGILSIIFFNVKHPGNNNTFLQLPSSPLGIFLVIQLILYFHYMDIGKYCLVIALITK